MRKCASILSLVLLLVMSAAFDVDAKEGKGSVCLGPNLSVVLNDRDHVTLSIGAIRGIAFSKDNSPRVVASDLDRSMPYTVTVHYDGDPVESWTMDFEKLGSGMVYIWRAKGGYKMKAGRGDACTWPAKFK